MRRLLAFSHSGVVDVNRAVYQKMAEALDVEISLVVPTRWRGDLIRDLRFESRPADRGLRIIPLPVVLSGNGSLFFYAAPLAPRLRALQPDHVFVHEEPWSLGALQAYGALRGFPRSFFTNQNLQKRVPPPFRLAEKWVFAESSHAYSLSDEATEVLRWKGFKKEIRYLPFSYDPSLFYPRSADARKERRSRLGIPEDAIVIGYLGRLTPEKGIDELVAAMRMALKEAGLERAHFLWVGNGPMAEAVRSFVAEAPKGRATYLQAVPHHEFGDTLACTDVLVLPSRTTPRWKEQFGRVLIEAMACGAAVIGSDSGEIPNLIRRTGGGRTFREGHSADLFARIRELVAEPESLRRLADAGRASASAHFTHEAVARAMGEGLGFQPR